MCVKHPWPGCLELSINISSTFTEVVVVSWFSLHSLILTSRCMTWVLLSFWILRDFNRCIVHHAYQTIFFFFFFTNVLHFVMWSIVRFLWTGRTSRTHCWAGKLGCKCSGVKGERTRSNCEMYEGDECSTPPNELQSVSGPLPKKCVTLSFCNLRIQSDHLPRGSPIIFFMHSPSLLSWSLKLTSNTWKLYRSAR